MAAHQGRCADCAREAEAEMQVRALWHSMPPPSLDAALWVKIAGRLDRSPARRAFPLFSAPRWRWAGAAALAAIIVGGLWVGPKEAAPPASTLPSAWRNAPPVQYASWTVLPDVSRSDPAVDDPAGAATERVWGVVNAQGAEAR